MNPGLGGVGVKVSVGVLVDQGDGVKVGVRLGGTSVAVVVAVGGRVGVGLERAQVQPAG